MSKGTSARAVVVGRLGKDPEFRMAGERNMATMSLAAHSGYGRNETTSWFTVVIFDEKKVAIIREHVVKGSRIMVGGELRIRKYQANGQDRWVTEIVLGFDGYLELLDSAPQVRGLPTGDNGEDRTRPDERPLSQRGNSTPSHGGFADFDPDNDEYVPF